MFPFAPDVAVNFPGGSHIHKADGSGIAGGKAAQGDEGLDVGKTPKRGRIQRLIVAAALEDGSAGALLPFQGTDNVAEVGLEEYGRGNAGIRVQAGGNVAVFEVEEDKQILVGGIFHAVELLHQTVWSVHRLEHLQGVVQILRQFQALAGCGDILFDVAHHNGGHRHQVGMKIHNLIKKVAAVVAGELDVPDQAFDLSNGKGFGGSGGVIYVEPRLKVDRIEVQLILKEKHQLFLLQEGFQVEAGEPGAELGKAGIVEVDVVFPARVFAAADVVPEVLQLILGENILSQDRFFQIFEKIMPDDRLFRVYIVTKPLFLRVIGGVAVVVEGVKADGQSFKF